MAVCVCVCAAGAAAVIIIIIINIEQGAVYLMNDKLNAFFLLVSFYQESLIESLSAEKIEIE